MKTAEITLNTHVTLNEAASLIVSNPSIRFLLQGEPGIGKSALLEQLAAQLDRPSAYIDVPNMDLGDIAMPVIDHDNKVTRYYPNSRFGLHNKKPMVIMLDEFSKGADAVKNMLHPLLEQNNPRLGDITIPEGTIIFLTGNLTSDGVGDTLKAHTRNRVCALEVKKPNATEWVAWANVNDIAPEVIAWITQYPHALESYRDHAQTTNPYIYSPTRVQSAFVTPRSLVTASRIAKTRAKNTPHAVVSALIGAIGEPAARDMQAYFTYGDQLAAIDEVLTRPKSARMPTSQGAMSVAVQRAILATNKKTLSAIATYVTRFSAEWQAVFFSQLALLYSTRGAADYAELLSAPEIGAWLAVNEDLL